MIPLRGRLSFKQYHRDKPIKWGMKLWILVDSKTGYNYSFDMYVGCDEDVDDFRRIGKVNGIVLKMAKVLYGQGYHLYFDRFYTSPHLLHWLRLVDLSGCGTVMTNREGFPKDLKVTGKGTQGESEWMQCANTGILARWWCDKKPIYFLSNIHVAERDGLAIRRHNKKGEAIMVNVIIGTETWLNSTINSNEIIKSALGFNVYRKDRPNKSYDCSNKRFD